MTKEKAMPFKSQKQRRLFHAKEKRGEISQATVEKWESETPEKTLPMRIRKAAEKRRRTK